MKDITNNIRLELLKMQDTKFRDFHKSLCSTSKYEIIGVRTPEIRKMAKVLITKDYEEFLFDEDVKYYEELLLKGCIIGSLKNTIEQTLKYLAYFIPQIDNWAICDCTCASLKITKKNMDEMWDFLQKYIKSNKEYEIRFALVMYIDYYMEERYLKEILKQIEKIQSKEYYVKMAIAWLIAEAFVKERDTTFEFIKSTKIDNWTFNKAIQKIIESYRVLEKDKSLLKSMRK